MYCTGKYIHSVLNLELERRKEFERRKKLRLLQVRQQSKEFADKLRERIKGEIIKQKTNYLEAENKLKQEEHLKELCQLKELYDQCLESIGSSHKEAAKQPDINFEKQTELDRMAVEAAKRGSKAMRKKLKEETVLKQKQDAPAKQKKATRNKENLRAFFVSSLPKRVENSRVYSVSPLKTANQNTEPSQTRRVLDEIPTNVNLRNSRDPDSQNHKHIENLHIVRKESKVEEKQQSRVQESPETVPAIKPTDCASVVSSPEECSCGYIICYCHQSPRALRRRCSSESRLSSDKVSPLNEPIKKKVRSRSFSPQSVRTLNYLECGNVYESNQRSSVRVTHHSRSPERTEELPKSKTVDEVPIPKPSLEELKKRAKERSAKALKKEQLKKDFQHLIQNLKKLSEEKSVISSKTKGKLRVLASERDIVTRNKTKQKKLNDAFEKLPHSLKSEVQTTGADKPNLNQISSNVSPPPTLNLALCQTNMCPYGPRKVCSERDVSKTPRGYKGNTRLKSRSSRARSESPNVIVKTDSSGDVHITVKVSEMSQQKPQSSPSSRSLPSSDSSYISPPSNLTPSQQRLIQSLLCQVNKKVTGNEMRKYIQKLLNMSRDSIENLYSSPQTQSPLDKSVEQDLEKLSQLAEVYAEKVNTLVDMYEQLSTPSPTHIDPIRAPPSRELPPRSLSPASRRSASPRIRTMEPAPASVRFKTPSPASGSSRTPTPKSSGYGRTSQPRYIPRESKLQQAVTRYHHPERARTSTPTYIPALPIPSGPWGSPHIPPVAPPYSQNSKIPIVPGRQPRGARSPPRIHPLISPLLEPYRRPPATLKRPPQPPVNQPWSSNLNRSICPPQNKMRNVSFPQKSPPRNTTMWGLDTIRESPEHGYVSSMSGSTVDTSHTTADTFELMFGGIPGAPMPTRAEVDAVMARAKNQPCNVTSSSPEDYEAWFNENRDKMQQMVGRGTSSPMKTQESFDIGEPGEDFEQDFGCPASSSEEDFRSPEPTSASPGQDFGCPGIEPDFGSPGQGFASPEPTSASPGQDFGCPGIEPDFGSPGQGFASFGPTSAIPGQDFGSPGYEPDFGSPGQGFASFGPTSASPGPTYASPGQGFSSFGQDFGDFASAQSDFAMGFTDDDFKTGMDALLQEEARSEDYVDYPEDFPAQTDVFGPGFDWDAANLDEPKWPRSFPGAPLEGHSMSSAGSVKLDTSFDISALQGPINPGRLNAIREKLSKICNDQYREILEMLKEDASTHQLKYGNILKQATSDPFLDPNATLAPVRSPSHSSGVEYLSQHISSPRSTRSGFRSTDITPPHDKRITDYQSPTGWNTYLPSHHLSGSEAQASMQGRVSPQFSDFSNDYSNVDDLMLLMKNQERECS